MFALLGWALLIALTSFASGLVIGGKIAARHVVDKMLAQPNWWRGFFQTCGPVAKQRLLHIISDAARD